MIIDRGVPIRPDWENVISPVVDYLQTRPDVDRERIALIGLSLAGYLAPRAATAEHRLAACVSDCGPYDVFDVTARRLPGFLARQLPDGSPRMLEVNRLIVDDRRYGQAGQLPYPLLRPYRRITASAKSMLRKSARTRTRSPGDREAEDRLMRLVYRPAQPATTCLVERAPLEVEAPRGDRGDLEDRLRVAVNQLGSAVEAQEARDPRIS
jgi:predicted dienelactone hydrolase